MIPNVEMSYYEKLGCLQNMFVNQAQETPDNIAVVSADGRQMSFSELDYITDVVAVYLQSLGVGRNRVVGILMERCVEYVISYIAILKAGGAYLPIEMSYPPSLVNSVLKDAQPVAICTKAAYAYRLSNTVTIINVEKQWLEMLKKEYPNVYLSVENSSLDDMAYTVYSSGTTGEPKGIQCPHRGAVFSYTWRHLSFPYEKDDREACNIFFVWEMLRPLLKGIPMYIIPDTVIYDPPQLLQFLRRNQITRMLFTPSLLQIILDTQKPKILTESFKSMRQIWLCGEVVTTTLRNKVASTFPWLKILNLYSISECHDVSCADLTSNFGLEGRTYCPVGKIFPQVRVLIMDENFNIKPIGDVGEIYVGGPTLAIGYLNRPLLNEQKFIKTPSYLVKTVGERMYKTGDRGYLLSDGSLEVIGRCDSMVKIRGYTIELKAVERALLNIPDICTACVVTVGSESNDKMLVAYVVLNEGCSRTAGYLHAELKKQLPFYMIPSRFLFLNQIPIIDTTGKINKSKLPEVQLFHEAGDVNNCDELTDETLKLITRIWCKVLKQFAINTSDNFFDLGGHSLLAAIVVSQINDSFGCTLKTSDLFANPTVNALAKIIKTGTNGEMEAVNLPEELKKFAIQQIPNIKLRIFWKSVNFLKFQFERSHVLLTGATGFLGSFILQNLLKNTQTTVYCLVRTSATESAEERILNILKARGFSEKLLNTRLILLTGDVSLNKFGLEEVEYAALCYSIDVVIHCAAHVNLILPYSALSKVNVTGTHNTVIFCLEKKLKPLHYICTSDVFAAGMKDCSENANMFGHVEKLKYGYAQSKWLAEQIVMSASQNGLPTIISRCGNISGCRNTAAWNKNDMTLLILQSVVLSQTAPDIPWQIEITPVDFTCDVIVKLTKNITNEFGKVYHIINRTTMDCRQLWDILRDKGYKIKSVSYEEWTDTVTKASANSDELKPMIHLLNSRLKTSEYLVNRSTYCQENLNKFLVSHNLQYPQTNRFLIDKYLQDLVINGYLPPCDKYVSAPQIGTVSPRLQNKVALVTGASSGIGHAIATTLAKAGIITVGVARQFSKLVQLQKELLTDGFSNFIPFKVDITKREEIFECVKQVETTIGAVDILVNNAGIMEYCKMINAELDCWLKMVDVNCNGFLHVIAAVLPKMKIRQSGHIINITSDAGRKAFSNLAVYSGTKFFEEAVSEALRQEIATYGIKVSCIQPGDVSTGLHQKSIDQETMIESAYSIEYLKVNEIANAVLFILDQSSNCAINTILIEPVFGPI